MNSFYLIGFIQSLFVSSLLLFKKQKILSDFVLVFYILVLGFFLFFNYADGTDLLSHNPIIYLLDVLYWTLIGPLLFIYIDLVASGKKKLQINYLIHLLPTIIVLAGFSSFFFQDEVTNIFTYNPGISIHRFSTFVWYYNSPLYYLICLYLLYRHKSRVKEIYSFTKNVDLSWLFYLVHGFAAVLFYGLFIGYFATWFNFSLPFGSVHYNWFVMIIYIFGMGYYGFRQKGLFSADLFKTGESDIVRTDQNHKISVYKKSTIEEGEAKFLESTLTKIMAEEKPYLDCELDLRELAQKLDTSPHKLSQLINERLDCNFYEFVNNYRIAEVKKALIDPKNKNLKIMAVAYDSGFNSKSSFYNIFKKYTGLNPSKYKEEYSS